MWFAKKTQSRGKCRKSTTVMWKIKKQQRIAHSEETKFHHSRPNFQKPDFLLHTEVWVGLSFFEDSFARKLLLLRNEFKN